MNYKDFDIFLINKDNWKEQENVLFGFKTIGDNGIWINVFKENQKLFIKGSYIQPYLYIYKTDDYWALSNCFYLLEKHLKEKGLVLTKNKFFTENTRPPFTFCIECPEQETLYNEIRINDNFTYMEIDNDELYIKPVEIDSFKKPFYENKQLILNWYERYKNYLYELSKESKNISLDFSGGFDTRILFNMWCDIPGVEVKANWRKADEPEHYYDGLLARWYIERHGKQKYNVSSSLFVPTVWQQNNPDYVEPTPKKTKKYKNHSKERSQVVNYLFSYGAIPMDETTLDIDNLTIERRMNFKYHLVGMSLELHKNGLANSIEEIRTTTRRSMLLKYLIRYYSENRITISPYQDREFLTIEGFKNFDVPQVLLALFNLNDPEIPIYSGGKMFFLDKKTTDELLSKFKD